MLHLGIAARSVKARPLLGLLSCKIYLSMAFCPVYRLCQVAILLLVASLAHFTAAGVWVSSTTLCHLDPIQDVDFTPMELIRVRRMEILLIYVAENATRTRAIAL